MLTTNIDAAQKNTLEQKSVVQLVVLLNYLASLQIPVHKVWCISIDEIKWPSKMVTEIKNSHFLLQYIKALLTLEIHIISVKRNKT